MYYRMQKKKKKKKKRRVQTPSGYGCFQIQNAATFEKLALRQVQSHLLKGLGPSRPSSPIKQVKSHGGAGTRVYFQDPVNILVWLPSSLTCFHGDQTQWQTHCQLTSPFLQRFKYPWPQGSCVVGQSVTTDSYGASANDWTPSGQRRRER